MSNYANVAEDLLLAFRLASELMTTSSNSYAETASTLAEIVARLTDTAASSSSSSLSLSATTRVSEGLVLGGNSIRPEILGVNHVNGALAVRENGVFYNPNNLSTGIVRDSMDNTLWANAYNLNLLFGDSSLGINMDVLAERMHQLLVNNQEITTYRVDLVVNDQPIVDIMANGAAANELGLTWPYTINMSDLTRSTINNQYLYNTATLLFGSGFFLSFAFVMRSYFLCMPNFMEWWKLKKDNLIKAWPKKPLFLPLILQPTELSNNLYVYITTHDPSDFYFLTAFILLFAYLVGFVRLILLIKIHYFGYFNIKTQKTSFLAYIINNYLKKLNKLYYKPKIIKNHAKLVLKGIMKIFACVFIGLIMSYIYNM